MGKEFSKQKKILTLIKTFLKSKPELRASELFLNQKIGLPAQTIKIFLLESKK